MFEGWTKRNVMHCPRCKFLKAGFRHAHKFDSVKGWDKKLA
jgi:hypothetical protein